MKNYATPDNLHKHLRHAHAYTHGLSDLADKSSYDELHEDAHRRGRFDGWAGPHTHADEGADLVSYLETQRDIYKHMEITIDHLQELASEVGNRELQNTLMEAQRQVIAYVYDREPDAKA